MSEPSLVHDLLEWGRTIARAGWTVGAALDLLGAVRGESDQYGLREIELEPRDVRLSAVQLEWVEGAGDGARVGVVTLWASDAGTSAQDFQALLGPGRADPVQTVGCCPADGAHSIQTFTFDVDDGPQLQATFNLGAQGLTLREARLAPAGTWRGSRAERDPVVGTTLMSRYRVLARLGTDELARVYSGEHVLLGRKVVIRLLRPEVASNVEAVIQFQRQARETPGVLDLMLDDRMLCIVLEAE